MADNKQTNGHSNGSSSSNSSSNGSGGGGGSGGEGAASPDNKSQVKDLKVDTKEHPDPGMRLSASNVEKARNDTSGRVYRVYADGIFDLFHIGHMKMLEQVKKSLGDPKKVCMVAGVNTDVDTHKYKGKTVMNQKTRVESVRHCKWVDEVIEEGPWVVSDEFMEKHKLDFIAHDAIPYKDTSGASADGDVYGPIKKKGKFLETQRTDGISTSDLIVTIVRDYDDYVKRNLARGYTKQDLNVGRTWEMRAQAHEAEKRVGNDFKEIRTEFGELSSALKGFVRGFDPRHLFQNEDGSSGFSPRNYADSIREGIPDVVHHAVGLARSVWDVVFTCASWCIPCCWCSCLCRKTKDPNSKK